MINDSSITMAILRLADTIMSESGGRLFEVIVSPETFDKIVWRQNAMRSYSDSTPNHPELQSVTLYHYSGHVKVSKGQE